MRRVLIGLLSCGLVVSCSDDRETFSARFAESYCEWLAWCDKLVDLYGNMSACLSNQISFANETIAPEGACFNDAEAERCVDSFEARRTCDPSQPLPESCQRVQTCTTDAFTE